jgi:hypothetical protein
MSDIKPHKIEVPEEAIQRLKQKLELVDFPEELEDADWIYGSPMSDTPSPPKFSTDII